MIDFSDLETLVKRATIGELKTMIKEARQELYRRSYVCMTCGRTIPQALAEKHPDHDRECHRYASMVTHSVTIP